LEHNVSLSFTIVTYNNQDKIKNTILSIITAVDNLFPYKIFIVDNESTDKTLEIVRSINNKQIEIVPSENQGFGFGHNVVLNRLQSMYHFIINPDIKIKDSQSLQVMINYMNENPSVGLLSPLILNEDGSIQYLFRNQPTILDAAIRFAGKKILRKRQEKFINLKSGYNKILPIENASGSFMLVRTDIFKAVKGFDERYFMYYEDTDLTRKINEISSAMFVPTASVMHSWERANGRDIRYIWIMLQSLYKYMQKWGWILW